MSCHGRLLVTAVAAVRLRTSFRSVPRALFHQQAMMFRTFPEHFCTTFGTMFFTAWNAIPVWNTRVAFRTDTTPAAAHVVFPFKLDHCDSLVGSFLKACGPGIRSARPALDEDCAVIPGPCARS
jgi:hypothetical protein